MRPEGEREGYHLEADDEQFALIRPTASKQQPFSYKKVLQMIHLDQKPGVEGTGVDGRVREIASVVCE